MAKFKLHLKTENGLEEIEFVGTQNYHSVYIDWATISNVEYDDDTVFWDTNIIFKDENDEEIQRKPVTIQLPIIAGNGIEFVQQGGGKRMVISATNTGGGSGDADTFVVHFNYDSEGNFVADQPFDEIYSKIQDGKMPFAELWDKSFSCYYSYENEIGFMSIQPYAGSGVGGDNSNIFIDYISLNSDGYANNWSEYIEIPSGSQGSGAGQQSVTYAQLKKLRDDGKLVAGMQYRITDFVTTTSQPDTQSAGHPFNIIVIALSNTTLSENASADLPATNIANADGSLAQGSVQPYYYVFEDFNDANGPTEGYKAGDIFVAYDYLENNDGVVVPVIYKNEVEAYGEEGPDYQDIFYYEGTTEVDGVTYDKWRKICEDGDGPFWDGSTGSIWVLTNIIVKDGQIGGGAVDPYFANANLPAWEIKYCLDNDKKRFVWADEGGIEAIRVYSADDVSDFIYVRTPDGDNENGIAWCYVIDSEGLEFSDIGDWNNYAGDDVIYTETEIVAVGDFLDMSGTEVEVMALKYGNGGKGVIYYMKDEYNNECPYDFKNIQFIRKLDDDGNLDLENGTDTWCYTFGGNQWDRSIPQEGCKIFNHNSICPHYTGCDMAFALPKNVFLGNSECMTKNNRLAWLCSDNTFGTECQNNTLGFNSGNNTFGHCCKNNILGNECRDNKFGYSCQIMTLKANCYNNTFPNHCYCVTLGNDVHSISLTSDTEGNLKYITIANGVFGNWEEPKVISVVADADYEQIFRKSGVQEILVD